MDANTKDVALALVGVLGSLGTGYIAYLATRRNRQGSLSGTQNNDPRPIAGRRLSVPNSTATRGNSDQQGALNDQSKK